MPTTEDVIISFNTRDNVSKVIQSLQRKIKEMSKTIDQLRKGASGMGDAFKGAGNNVNEVGSAVKNTGESINVTSSSTNTFAKNITLGAQSLRNLGDALYGIHSPFEKFLGFLGSGSIMTDMLSQASMRQSNLIMLGMNKSKESAQQYYDSIQQLVISLPGNDDFLNNLLVQISSMDQSIDIPEVEQIGNVVSDYYMLARAKGQTNFETEREIRNYLLTGSTLALQNSVISSQIKTLKNINNITDRSIALQKAMQAVGMDGIAHYDSYNNVIEMFRGRFQKAFADLGYPIMTLIQQLLKVFIEIDKITHSGASYVVIAFIGIIGALISTITTLGIVIRIAGMGIDAFFGFGTAIRGATALNSSMLTLTGITNGFTRAMYGSVSVQNLDTATKMTNNALAKIGIDAIGTETVLRGLNNEVLSESALLKLVENEVISQEVASRVLNGETISAENALLLEQNGIIATQVPIYEVNIGQKIRDVATSVYKNTITIVEIGLSVLKGEVTLSEAISNNVNTDSKLANVGASILQIRADIQHIMTVISETDLVTLNTVAKNSNVTAKIFIYTYTLYESIARFENMMVVEGETLQTTLQSMAEEGNIIAKGLIRVYTLSESIARWINSISINVETGSLMVQAKQKILDLWLALSGIVRRGVEIAQRIIKIGLIIAETIALVGLTGAVEILDAVITTATGGVNKVLAIILLAIIGLIAGIYELGKAFGWWDSIKGVFEAISSGVQRLWNAFVNSEPIQKAITSVQNFVYTIQSLFNFIGSIGGGLWELIFGVDDGSSGGAFDIVAILEGVVGFLAEVFYYASGLFIIVGILDTIGSAIAYVLDTWNQFIDSAEMQALIKGFQEVREAFGEVWNEFSSVISEIQALFGELWEAIFGSTEETEESSDGVNILLVALRAFASLLNSTVIPVLKAFAYFLHTLIAPLHWVADTLRNLIGVFKGTSDEVENTTQKGGDFFDVFNSIGNVIEWVADSLNAVFGETIDALGRLWEVLQPIIDIIIQILDALASEVVDGVIILINGLANALTTLVNIGKSVVNIFVQMWNAIGGLDGIINGLQWAFNTLVSALQPVAEFINHIVDGAKWLAEKFGWVGEQVSDFLQQDGNLQATNNTNYGEENAISLFNTIGIDPKDALQMGKDFNSAVNSKNQEYLNRPINNAQSNDTLTRYLRDSPIDSEAYGYLTQPVDYSKTPTMTQQYNQTQQRNQQVVQNIFNEGSVQADARNMSAKDVQTLFTGAFGYNKARGTEGILK